MTDELDMFPVLLVMELTAACDFSETLVMIMLRLLTDTLTLFSGFFRQEKALRLVKLQHSEFAYPWRRQAVDGERIGRDLLLSPERRHVQLLPVHSRGSILAGR